MTNKLKEAREDFIKSAGECNYAMRKMVKAINILNDMLTPLTDDEVEGLKYGILDYFDIQQKRKLESYNKAIFDISKDYWLIKKGEK